MITLILCVVLYLLLASLTAIHARKKNALYWSDAGLPIIVLAFWVAVTASGYGHQSLGHIIEVPLALLFALILFKIRVFVADKYLHNWRINSYVVLALSLIFVLGLRSLMPLLPE